MTLATVTPAFADDHGVINAAALNSWRTELAKAMDGSGVLGSATYTLTAPLNVTGSGFGTIDVHTLCDVAVGGQTAESLGAIIADTNNQTFALAGGQLREFATPTAQRDHDLSTAGAIVGSYIHFMRPATGNFPIIIRRSGFVGGAIVTLQNLTWSTATVYYDVSGVWRLLDTSGGTAGADA